MQQLLRAERWSELKKLPGTVFETIISHSVTGMLLGKIYQISCCLLCRLGTYVLQYRNGDHYDFIIRGSIRV